LPANLETVDSRKHQIQKDHGGIQVFQTPESVFSSIHRFDNQIFPFQMEPQQILNIVFVLKPAEWFPVS